MSIIRECWPGQRKINSPASQSTARGRCAISCSENCFPIPQQLPRLWQHPDHSHHDQLCLALRKNAVYMLDVITMLNSLEALTRTSLHSSQGALQSSNTLPGTELQQTVFVCCWTCHLLLVWPETRSKQKDHPWKECLIAIQRVLLEGRWQKGERIDFRGGKTS